MEIIIGSHVGFKKDTGLYGSVKEALSYGANALMLYTGAPQNTMRSKIDENLTKKGIELLKESGIDLNNVIVHAPYIVNLASGNSFAIEFLKAEIERVASLGLSKIVLHPGSYVSLTLEEGINNIIKGLNEVLTENSPVTILLETMAGKGTEIGRNFQDIKMIIDGIKYNQYLGVCMDTCHLNDSGYDVKEIDSILDEFDQIIGIEKLGCIHINDSKNNIGESKDRHENFGFGTIGFETLINIVYHNRLKDIPKILETPYVTKNEDSKEKIYPPYKQEIEMIKKKTFDENLIKNIRSYYK